jgi:hypothetical protein
MLKLGRYTFEKTDRGFTVYTTVSNFFHEDGSPWLERVYSLDIRRTDDNRLLWSLWDIRLLTKHVGGDKAPKTIAKFAHDVCTGSTIFEF